MLRSLYRKFSSARELHAAAKAGLLEFDVGVTVSPTFSIKFQGTRKCQLRVGARTHLDGRIVVRGNGEINIGQYCSFRAGTYIGSVESIRIGSNVFGAEGVFICDNNNHPVDPVLRKAMSCTPMGGPLWSWHTEGVKATPVVIEDNVWLGKNCALLKGVNIGRDSVIAFGAIVTKSVPAGSVAAGNPAVVVKSFPTLPL